MDWKNKVPPFESQYSVATHTDVQDCTCEATCHVVFLLTGKRFSPRALAFLAKVTPTGTWLGNVINAANNNGLIPYDLWPTPDSFTWDSYYAPIPTDILSKGVSLGIKLIPPDLNKSPLLTQLEFGFPSPGIIPEEHLVAQLNTTEYFDSELGGPIKPLSHANAIKYQTSILITKPMNEAKIAKSKKSSSIYWCYEMPDMDYLHKKANIEGVIIPDSIPDTDSL